VFLWSESSLHASGDVGGSLRRGATNFELTSDELSLERTDRGAEELSSGSVIARGNVNMTSLDGDISGSGDLLEVDRLGRGMLTADPGNRVRARGNFPGGRYPFDMTATWIQFSDVFLDAVDPEVEFDYLQAGVGGGVAKARGRADRLEATPESVELSGRIRLEGTDQEQNPWKLEADRARIDGANLAGRGILAGLRASGNVGFELGSTIRARGEEFSVRTTQRRVRIAGDPAYVEYEGMTFNSAWIEYDLLVHLLRAGKGRIEPNPK
jgi:lipopolysaccharide export system protein LptA